MLTFKIKLFFGVGLLLILITGFAAGIYLVGKQTVFKSKAFDPVVMPTFVYLNSKVGFNIGVNSINRINIPSIVSVLKPHWVRYIIQRDGSIPDFGIPNSKLLAVFSGEAAEGALVNPGSNNNRDLWMRYINEKYLPVLNNFLNRYPDVGAIEVWNEPDLNCLASFCPTVSADVYSYMLREAAKVIKARNPNIKVISAGLASGNTAYLSQIKSALTQVDGVGLHPYGVSPGGWCAQTSNDCPVELPNGNVSNVINAYFTTGGKPVWVTEVGTGTILRPVWQAEYLNRIFKALSETGVVPVIIWYSFSDYDSGGGGETDMGLVSGGRFNAIKAAGLEFELFTN